MHTQFLQNSRSNTSGTFTLFALLNLSTSGCLLFWTCIKAVAKAIKQTNVFIPIILIGYFHSGGECRYCVAIKKLQHLTYLNLKGNKCQWVIVNWATIAMDISNCWKRSNVLRNWSLNKYKGKGWPNIVEPPFKIDVEVFRVLRTKVSYLQYRGPDGQWPHPG